MLLNNAATNGLQKEITPYALWNHKFRFKKFLPGRLWTFSRGKQLVDKVLLGKKLARVE
jgi:hypothetical protein